MVYLVNHDLFKSPAQTLVNTVNTEGVMGKGIAKEFKKRFPAMFKEYRALTDHSELEIGQLHVWRGPSKWVLNFPTKTTWRKPSKLSYVEEGLRKFVVSYEQLGIESVSFPPLGCGNGNLDWDVVRPIMFEYLSSVKIPVFIHDVQVSHDFVPEHELENDGRSPGAYGEFRRDLEDLVSGDGGRFLTTGRGRSYDVQLRGSDLSIAFSDGKNEIIFEDDLQAAWNALQTSILTRQESVDDRRARHYGYLIPLLERLPYVSRIKFRTTPNGASLGTGLALKRQSVDAIIPEAVERQSWLFHDM